MELTLCIGFYDVSEKSYNESGLGKIWVRGSGVCFPEENWDDFIVMGLTEWTGGFCLHLENHSPSFVIQFFDGPFGVKIELDDSGNYSASFGDPDLLEAGEGEPLKAGIPVLLKPLLNQILQANRALFDHFEKNDFKPSGLDNLRKWHLKLMIKEALLDKS